MENRRIFRDMLNLPIAMFLKISFLTCILPLLLGVVFQQTGTGAPRVDVPLSGDTVRGVVGVAGTTQVEGFASSEVFFGFSSEGEWFSLGIQSTPIQNGLIANWDTSVIPDGTYRLKVVVTKADGSRIESVVEDLKVRNYSSGQDGEQSQPASRVTPLPDYQAQPARNVPSNPVNPAAVGRLDLSRSVRAGALWSAGLFVILGVYLGLRWFNRRK